MQSRYSFFSTDRTPTLLDLLQVRQQLADSCVHLSQNLLHKIQICIIPTPETALLSFDGKNLSFSPELLDRAQCWRQPHAQRHREVQLQAEIKDLLTFNDAVFYPYADESVWQDGRITLTPASALLLSPHSSEPPHPVLPFLRRGALLGFLMINYGFYKLQPPERTDGIEDLLPGPRQYQIINGRLFYEQTPIPDDDHYQLTPVLLPPLTEEIKQLGQNLLTLAVAGIMTTEQQP